MNCPIDPITAQTILQSASLDFATKWGNGEGAARRRFAQQFNLSVDKVGELCQWVNSGNDIAEYINSIPMPNLECARCGAINPFIYYAPAAIWNAEQGLYNGVCKCLACATEQGFLNSDGNLKAGIEL